MPHCGDFVYNEHAGDVDPCVLAFLYVIGHSRYHTSLLICVAGCTGGFTLISNLSVLLFTTAETEEESDECIRAILRIRNALRSQSKAYDVVRLARLRVDSLFWKGFENLFKPRQLPRRQTTRVNSVA